MVFGLPTHELIGTGCPTRVISVRNPGGDGLVTEGGAILTGEAAASATEARIYRFSGSEADYHRLPEAARVSSIGIPAIFPTKLDAEIRGRGWIACSPSIPALGICWYSHANWRSAGEEFPDMLILAV
jgi:hypothetical protein